MQIVSFTKSPLINIHHPLINDVNRAWFCVTGLLEFMMFLVSVAECSWSRL